MFQHMQITLVRFFSISSYFATKISCCFVSFKWSFYFLFIFGKLVLGLLFFSFLHHFTFFFFLYFLFYFSFQFTMTPCFFLFLCQFILWYFLFLTLKDISLVYSLYSYFPFVMSLKPFKFFFQFFLPLLFLSIVDPFQVLFFHSLVHIYQLPS
jgi:hypothetical protein